MDQKAKLEINISGLTYIPDFISAQEQDLLLSQIDQQPWLTDLKRRVQHYGYKYDYKARIVGNDTYLGPLPDWLSLLSEKLRDDCIFPSLPDQVIVNEYLPGQGISAHIDCVPCFANTIASLSLGSPCIMEFSNSKTNEKNPLPDRFIRSCPLRMAACHSRQKIRRHQQYEDGTRSPCFSNLSQRHPGLKLQRDNSRCGKWLWILLSAVKNRQFATACRAKHMAPLVYIYSA